MNLGNRTRASALMGLAPISQMGKDRLGIPSRYIETRVIRVTPGERVDKYPRATCEYGNHVLICADTSAAQCA